MPSIRVNESRKRDVVEAHRQWAKDSNPRRPGQVGECISTLIEGPSISTVGEIRPYSDFDSSTSDATFHKVDQSFLDYLKASRIPYEVISAE